MRYYVIALLVLAFSAPAMAGAVGLSVAPGELVLSGPAGEELRGELTVTNTSNGAALFEAYADDPDLDISLGPESFMLESGASRTVKVSLRPKVGKTKTMLSVVVSPVSGGGFQAGAGIKVPLTATAEGSRFAQLASIGEAFKNNGAWIGGILAALFLFFRYFRISFRRGKR